MFDAAFWSGPRAVCLLLWTSAFCILHSAFSAPATGAKIDESKVVKTYYVDPAGANADDDNEHGTQDAPFLTIKRALDAALRDKDANVGARVIIGPGIYRESIDIPPPSGKAVDTDAPLVVEAAERGQTIIDGADLNKFVSAETWKQDGSAWTHRWFGTRPNAALAPALLILDGSVMRQTATPAALAPGAFCEIPALDEKKKPAVNARLLPPEGTEVSADSVFQLGERTFGVAVSHRRNVIVRGLVVQHASGISNNFAGSAKPVYGIGIYGCSNVLVEDVLSQWNDGVGLLLKGSATAPWSEAVTLRRVQLIHNGQDGLAAENLKNVLAEDCETSFNHFREEWAAAEPRDPSRTRVFTSAGWSDHRMLDDRQGAAGVKAHGLHGSTWRRQRAVANFARGLWWSSDCTDLLVEDAVVRDNLFSGLFIANCSGPSVVRGCLITGNRLLATSKPETSQPAAVSFEASPDVTLENNVVAGNLMPQLGLRDVAERTDGTDFETGAKLTLRAERHVYRHNAFYGADADQTLVNLPVADRAGKGDFTFYYATLDSDENCFWNPASPEVFCTFDHANYRRPGMTLAGWRTFLAAHANAGNAGQGDRRPEAGSLWEDPRFMEPAEADYRLQSQSPLIDWGLPAEEGGAAQ